MSPAHRLSNLWVATRLRRARLSNRWEGEAWRQPMHDDNWSLQQDVDVTVPHPVSGEPSRVAVRVTVRPLYGGGVVYDGLEFDAGRGAKEAEEVARVLRVVVAPRASGVLEDE